MIILENIGELLCIQDTSTHPSELSCKQDLGQDTRYRNVSRS